MPYETDETMSRLEKRQRAEVMSADIAKNPMLSPIREESVSIILSDITDILDNIEVKADSIKAAVSGAEPAATGCNMGGTYCLLERVRIIRLRLQGVSQTLQESINNL
jgi:hypothetical protein